MTQQDLAALEQALATGIGQQETGNGAAGVGLTLNNPGAIKYAPWEVQYGAIQQPSGFAKFPTMAQGRAAMVDLIGQYISKGNSLQTLISGWAPASDGNVNNDARVAQLGQITGLLPGDPIAGQTPIGAAASRGSSGSSASSGIIDWGGTVQDLKDIFNGKTPKSVDEVSTPWGRAAAFVAGLILLTIGLVAMNTNAKVIVQEFGKGIVSGAKSAAVVAA